jgi:hypothetical protein
MATITLEKQFSYTNDIWQLRVNGVPIYMWYLRPKEEAGYDWENHAREVIHIRGTRYRNPVRSYPCIVGEINPYKLGSTLSLREIYLLCSRWNVMTDEFDAELRSQGWGDDIAKLIAE